MSYPDTRLHPASSASSKSGARRIPAAERRSALVQAAMSVVAERGVAAATTRAIVAEAGMSLASFHYAFESRDELMAELVAYVIEQQESALQPALAAPATLGSMRDAIRMGLQSFFDVVRQDPLREKAMFELTQYAMRSPGLESMARRQYASYYALAERALETASRLADADWEIPAADIARLLVVFTDGITLSWLVNRDDAAAATTMDFAADSIARLARFDRMKRTA